MREVQDLKAYKEETRKSTRRIATELGVSHAYISQVLNGKVKNISEEFKFKLSKYLEIPFDTTQLSYERGYEEGYKEAKQLVVQELMKSKTTEEKAKILDELIMCLIKQ